MAKKKKALRRLVGDIGAFGVGNVMIGAFSHAAAPVGGAGGLTGMSSMMSPLGTVIVAKGQIGMMGEALEPLDKIPSFKHKKKRKRY